jgi:hypothetical protein
LGNLEKLFIEVLFGALEGINTGEIADGGVGSSEKLLIEMLLGIVEVIIGGEITGGNLGGGGIGLCRVICWVIQEGGGH